MAVTGLLAQRLSTESGEGQTFQETGVNPVAPFVNALNRWTKDAKDKHDGRLKEMELDDESLFTAAQNASLRDQAEIEQEIMRIRDWDKEQIKSGVIGDQNRWTQYRQQRRDMLSGLRLYADRSAASEKFYEEAVSQLGSLKYTKGNEARARILTEMDKPIADRRVSAALQDIMTDPSLYDVDQYLTDRVASAKSSMSKAAYSETRGRQIMDYEVKYMTPFFKWDPDTNKLRYEIDENWAENVLNSSPGWFLRSVELGVEEKDQRVRELVERQESGEITPDESIELSKSLPFLTSDSRAKRIAILGDMMNSKAQSEVDLTSRILSPDRGPAVSAAERKARDEKRFLDARVDGFEQGNYDVVVNELNNYGLSNARQFAWEVAPDGKIRITYQKKDPRRAGSSKEAWAKYTMDVDPDDPEDIRDALAALYKIRTDEVSSRPSETPRAEDEIIASRLPEFESTEYTFNVKQIDAAEKQLKNTTDRKAAESIAARIKKYKDRNEQLKKEAYSSTAPQKSTGSKSNPFQRRN